MDYNKHDFIIKYRKLKILEYKTNPHSFSCENKTFFFCPSQMDLNT